jgi:integrase
VAKDGLWFRDGECWYLDTSVRGWRIRRSLKTTNRQQALARARQLVAELERAGPRVLRAERTTFHDLAALIRQDYDRNERKSTGKLVTVLQHLRLAFGKWQAAHIGPDDIADYIDRRKQQGAANGTVNRELAALKRSFHLAVRRKRLSLADIPTIDLLKEAAPRAGFFEREQFEAVRRYLPEPLHAVVTVAYITGWRIKSEILKLQWRQVSFEAETIRLDPGTTKNDDGRLFVMTPELRAVLLEQRAATEALQQATGQIVPLVFFHRKGKPIKAFRRVWINACRKAGVPGRIPHDFRRTAVRNLERAGVSRSVAMKMVGHKTESIYRRYAIVSESDLREAARKLAAVEQNARNGSHHDAGDQADLLARSQSRFDFDVVAGGPRRRSTDGRTRQ